MEEISNIWGGERNPPAHTYTNSSSSSCSCSIYSDGDDVRCYQILTKYMYYLNLFFIPLIYYILRFVGDVLQIRDDKCLISHMPVY